MANTYRTVYTNADGLTEFLGVGESYSGNAGEYKTNGALRQIEVDIPDMTKVITGTGFILDDTTMIPKGAFIESVTLVTKVAVTGSSSTLSVGTIANDRTSAQTANGFLNAVTLAAIAAVGTTLVYSVSGATGSGAYFGTALAADGLIVANWGTAAFTAGSIGLRINYSFWV